MAYFFKEWEIKTLIQDIETSGYALDDITLDILTSHGDPDYYGMTNAPKFKDRRAAITRKIQDFKRRTPQSWLNWVKGHGISPSQYTYENARAAAGENPKKKTLSDEDMDEITDKLDSTNLESQSFGFISKEEDSDPPFTPPRPINSPPMKGLAKKLRSPNLSPPRSVVYSGVTAATGKSTLSYQTADQDFTMPFGVYERPWKFDIVPGFSGRYLNKIGVYWEPKQVKQSKDGPQKFSYAGYLFMQQVNPPDVALYSCFLADDVYISMLHSNGILSTSEMDCNFVVFRGPCIEAFDRVGKGGIIPHQWISKESEENVKTCHASIKTPGEDDESPGPSWVYTIAKVPEDISLDNRVFSDHDFKVSPYESMPKKCKVPELADEEVLSFHVMWRIAIKGTETLMDETKKMSLAERMKMRRDQHK